MSTHLPTRPVASWLHLALLLVVVSALEVGRSAFGSQAVFTYAAIARSIYMWLPAIAGIAISINGPHAKVTTHGLMIGFTVVLLMIGLDVSGALGFAVSQNPAVYPDASVMAQASQLAIVSWVKTGLEWLKGDLGSTSQLSESYTFDSPRLRAAQALSDGPLILVVFASVGFVIAAMSWVRAHVVFKRSEDAGTANIVLAWLISPLVVDLARNFATIQKARALFRGTALWRPALAHVVITAFGVFVWWYSARYREDTIA